MQGRATQLSYLTMALLALGLITAAAADQPAPVQNAISRMAGALDLPAAQITVVSVEEVAWPDTSLGVRREGYMYLQVITHGYRVVLEGGGRRYEYHTDLGRRVVLADAGEGAPRGGELPAGEAAAAEPAAACRADLATRLNLPLTKIKTISVQPRVFPDASLGLPRPGEAVAQVETSGLVIVLFSGRDKYLYTATDKGFRYGGPVSSWTASALYLQPVQNEPNLNGNLCQVSLAGTGGQVLMEAVSEFWPQTNGAVLAKRRTSRSGHELLYLAPEAGATPRRLAGGFDVIAASLNPEGTRWGAVLRPSLGLTWVFIHGALDSDQAARVPLPDGARPQGLYWNQEQPMFVLEQDGKPGYYYTDLGLAEPAWKRAGSYLAPDREQWLLNKSETLVVENKESDGTPVTRVVRRWFTGDENPVVELKGFKYQRAEVWPGRFLLLTGERDGVRLSLTVDTATGEVLTTLPAAPETVKISVTRPRGWQELVGEHLRER